MSRFGESKRGLRVLVLEGAGAKGLSQLGVLSEIMNRVQEKQELDDVPGVHEWFEFIAGVDTAAFIAVLLGRLRVSIEVTMQYFKLLGNNVHSSKKAISKAGASTEHKTAKLIETLQYIVQDAGGNELEMMLEETSDGRSKTMIFAMSKHNMNAGIPTILRSYKVPANQIPDCAIFEAVAASMAHPAHFKGITIGKPPLNETYVSGSVGCSNPTAHVLHEVKRMCPNQHVACVVVVGAGHADTIHIPETSQIERLFNTADTNAVGMSLAMDAERVAHEMNVRFGGTKGFYFRLSVEQGLQKISHDGWDQTSRLLSHTRAYMRLPAVTASIDEIVKAITTRKPAVPTSHVDGEIQLPTMAAVRRTIMCPSPTPVFTGRQEKVEQIVRCVSHGDTQRCIFVLYGLGGAGKTQLALKTVEQTRDIWTDVVFVDASSHETAEASIPAFAQEKGIGDSHSSALRWLGDQRERWLMIIDNADNPSVDIKEYFPSGQTGSIIVTTRIPQHVLLAQGHDSDHRVSSMETDEAMDLLIKTTKIQEHQLTKPEREAASQLLENLGCLALAIVQAGAYIFSSQCSICVYLDLFLKHRKDTLEEYNYLPIKPDGYQKSVYTTWHMSYMLISTNAQRLLHLMAFMHHTGIVQDIFRRAAIRLHNHEPVIPHTREEAKIRAYLTECLYPYLDSAGGWNSRSFLNTMTELLSYSLISFDRASGAYSLHVLVQDWAGTAIHHPLEVALGHTALLLAVSIDYEGDLESLAYKRAVEIHASRLIERDPQLSANSAGPFAEVFFLAGNWKLKEKMEHIVLDGKLEAFGEEDERTLTTIHNLANSYRQQGRYDEALALQERVVQVSKRLSGAEHSETLRSMQNLAQTYHRLAAYTDAESLQLQTMQICKRVHGDEHADTLISMHELALTYNAQGRHGEAEPLLVRAVGGLERVRGGEHPETLASTHALASIYYNQGRYDEAESMQTHVLEVKQRRLGDKHPSTLTTMNDLARTYWATDRYAEAEVLYVQVVEAMKRMDGEEHPEKLTCMTNLAATYWRQGRYDEAEKLLKIAVHAQRRALGTRHPDTLLAIHWLLETYKSMGKRFCSESQLLAQETCGLENGSG